MYRFLLRPRWLLFTVAVLAAMAGMVRASMWQWDRHHERRAFNENVEHNLSQAPIEFSKLDPLELADDRDNVEWRTVTVAGSFVDAPVFEVVNRTQGGVSGRNMVAALELDDGRLMLVNRGFLTADAPAPALPEGTVEITALLRQSEQRSTGQGRDDPSQQLTQIRRIDIDVLQSQFSTELLPMYLQQLSSRPPDTGALQPIALPTLSSGPHLSYTIQWLIFTASVGAGWIFAVRRSAKRRLD